MIRMYNSLNKLLKNRYVPRWVIFVADLMMVVLAFFLCYSLRYSIASGNLEATRVLIQSIPLVAIYIISFLIFRPSAGVVRHTTTHDIQRIIGSVMFSGFFLIVLSLVSEYFGGFAIMEVPIGVIIIHSLVTTAILTFMRVSIKYAYHYITRITKTTTSVMIYGAGNLGQGTLEAIERSENPAYEVVGFIDTNRHLQGKSKSGVPIYSPAEAVDKILSHKHVQVVVIAIHPANVIKDAEENLFNYCLESHIELRKVPPVNEWIDGTFEARSIKRVSIDDLLGREQIRLDTERIQRGLEGKTIMVTGAAGSIGSEIARQLLSFNTGKLVLVDQAESALFDLQMEIKAKYNGYRDFEPVIADISHEQRLRNIFIKYRPEIVFNAAAYKHVPLMEDNVCEAVRVNIGGTKLLADMAKEFGVKKFVMISSDKAVNPTSVMGASKRVCEMYVQSLENGNKNGIQFITTRFGNVLGSNGSVVPLFTRQIEAGGPVTITHKEMKRYFMTIPEACQLVLEAGFMGQGGEIYLFNMGRPVKIYDLAVKMITLAGLKPEKDIRIVETGLRPGEKLFEELFKDTENNVPTHNPNILIARMSKADPEIVRREINELIDSAMKETDHQLVERIKNIVPEYEPQNPKYKDLLSNGNGNGNGKGNDNGNGQGYGGNGSASSGFDGHMKPEIEKPRHKAMHFRNITNKVAQLLAFRREPAVVRIRI
jgi:FlaA1/EpsC-like NDP-sugar epimerase